MNQKIFLIGLNHKTAGVEIREKFALTDIDNFEGSLVASCGVDECMALSTCNRVEITVVARNMSESELFDSILSFWAGACSGSAEELAEHIYRHVDLEAVRHLFTVACSLDSLVMGEPQILGQLKDAYRSAVDKGTARTVVNRLSHKAFSVAKRVRTETAIASSAVSISYAAVELARKIFGELEGTGAMLVGAGEMAELAATHLMNNGVKKLLIANRTFARAKSLASGMDGEPIPFEQLYENLHEVDIVISSTGSPTSVISARDVRRVLKKRKNRPMFFIDIAVPRDIDPDVNNLDNVYLYDIDDLKEVVEENMAQRQEEANKARAVVEVETDTFGNWLKSLKLKPTIVDMIGKSENIARQELDKTLKRLGPVDAKTKKALETLVLSVGHKVLHEPVCFLKRRSFEEGSDRFIDIARRMFNLDDEDVSPTAHLDRKPGMSRSCSSEEIESVIKTAKKEH